MPGRTRYDADVVVVGGGDGCGDCCGVDGDCGAGHLPGLGRTPRGGLAPVTRAGVPSPKGRGAPGKPYVL